MGFCVLKTNKELQKKALKVTKPEGYSLEVLVRKQPELC